MTTEDIPQSEAKRAKLNNDENKEEEEEEQDVEEEKSDIMEQAPESEWPSAWLMSDNVSDQKALNQCEPNVEVSPKELKD